MLKYQDPLLPLENGGRKEMPYISVESSERG